MKRLEPADPDYPPGLTDLRTAPPIWVRGNPPSGRMVAVVGTRHPDGDGIDVAERLTTALVDHGYGIVSGLARGVDSAAHRAALVAGGRTWAVVGAGADVVASEATALAAAMVEAPGSGILSELEPGTAQTNRALVARDRLQSALSAAVVVVQTDLRSGTMHTARFALTQRRPLVVVRPDGTQRSGRGLSQWAGNGVLVDPDGCDPALLHATGEAARLIAARRPVADLAIGPDGPWDEMWALLDERYQAR
jgi:DNA processing protein